MLRRSVWVALLLAAACHPATMEASRPSPAPAGASIPADEAATLMAELAEKGTAASPRAVSRILGADDERFVPVFIELIRASEIGIVPADPLDRGLDDVAAVQKLSGRRLGRDWQAWATWYAGTDIRPPPGFAAWKAELFGRIDPHFAELLDGAIDEELRIEEVQWGGVAFDGIPALDDPSSMTPLEADYLTDDEPVFGLQIEDQARAYPLRILDWHEMVNDHVGGRPVSLAYCTLCGTGIAYDVQVGDIDYDFGSSGLLYRSNKLMYDRQTRSLWNQFTGRPVIGELVGGGVQLDSFPLVVTRWSDWVDQHPDTTVLDIDTGFERPYELGAAYGDYFASGTTLFPVDGAGDGLPAKTRVFGLTLEGRPVAYPLDILASEQVVNDRIADRHVTIVATRGTVRVAATERPEDAGDVFYEAGGEVRAYLTDGRRFRHTGTPGRLRDDRGRSWRVTEMGLRGPGPLLRRVTGVQSYWFAWRSFNPSTRIYSP